MGTADQRLPSRYNNVYGAGRGILRNLNLNVRYIAALKPDRFTRIVNFLSPHVQSTGDSAWAWNNERNEAALKDSSRDKNIGKKFTLSNCFSLRRVRQPRDYVPIYDEYRAMFSGCDKFNQLLHNKTFHLHTSGIRYVAALKSDRFRNIVQLLKPPVRNTGDSAWAWNEARKEAAVYHSSRDTNVGKKFTLTNCFERSSNPQPQNRVPIYDEYKVMFSGCDKFNQSLHNRTLPFRLPNDINKARDENIRNYLVTSAVINTWNI